MADLRLVISILVIINSVSCEKDDYIRRKMEALNNRSKELYGTVGDDVKWDSFDLEYLMYPRGDKRKLSILSRAWQEYYECLARLAESVPPPRFLPNVISMLFQGSVARLPCNLCAEPGSTEQLTWIYSKGGDEINITAAIEDFSDIQSYDRLSVEGRVVTIYNVIPEDEGVYSCRDGDTQGGIVIIEVVDTENYTVVKPTTSRGPHPVAPETYEGVILSTQWSQWSECSVCDKVGRRHRYGICYVNLDQNLIADYLVDSEKTTARFKLMELDIKLIELFQAFPGGVPCRSQYLPQPMKALDVVQQRPSEIMIGMCKVPCIERNPYEKLENSNDVYPVNYQLPKQPPPPVTTTIFATVGQRITLRCPGTTLRDVPISWRVGSGAVIVPRQLAAAGRGHVSSRDHLVIHTALLHDHNLYSCWQRDKLAGAVKLVVGAGWQQRWAPALAVLGALAALAAAALLRPRARGQRALYYIH
ncbi:Ig-like V-type domain-containing protein FAM187A isoform X2 [Spodoptera frugiperda]|uniref:Ig-like V-type domain-containing protein FAM187A isoform X2 n=1 Tax=Spodoptera frugiperda TaxID=7108 RepID=A0A9R0CZA0_SPOFR|nr:Ig-like V-type domain-containing protein FAM187A isoform X2 [Spodoptera frugiperda]